VAVGVPAEPHCVATAGQLVCTTGQNVGSTGSVVTACNRTGALPTVGAFILSRIIPRLALPPVCAETAA